MFLFSWSTFAATVTFDGSNGLFIGTGSSAFIENFVFTINPGLGTTGGSAFGFVTIQPGNLIDNGSPAFASFNGARVTMSPAFGGTFSPASFDVTGTFLCCQQRNAIGLQVLGFRADGGIASQIFDVNTVAFARANLNSGFTDLTSMQFIGIAPLSPNSNSPEFQLDNIVILPPVPEPGTIGLLGGCLAILGPVLRRRRQARQ